MLPHELPHVSDREFELIRRLIYDKAGIHLRDSKKNLVSNRLRKRLDHFGFDSYQKYYDLIAKMPEEKSEIAQFINALTTNETFFFRHPEHFEYLEKNIFPRIVEQDKPARSRKIRIWCAACSSGEEPYSIALLIQANPFRYREWSIEILGTDINGNMIDMARQGVYSPYAVGRMRPDFRKRYFEFNPRENAYRLAETVRRRVRFDRSNLLTPPVHGKFDVIFCRNVMIYFDAESKKRALQHLYDSLAADGTLIVGYAESLLGDQTRFKYVMPTVYRKIE
jgi:chemotaxis protein methyltransferase CheR